MTMKFFKNNPLENMEKKAVLKIFNDTLDNNTMDGIKKGKIFVSDQAINEAIKRCINREEKAPVQSVSVQSHADGRLEIFIKIDDEKSIRLTGMIEEFICSGDKAVFTYKTNSHTIEGRLMPSWIFSRLTLGFMCNFINEDKIPDNVDVTIDDNVIKVDFTKIIESSKLGTANIKGIRLLDILEVVEAVPGEGGIEIKTRLNIGKEIIQKVSSALKQ